VKVYYQTLLSLRPMMVQSKWC